MPYYKKELIWNKKPKTKTQTSPIDKAEARAWTYFSKYIRLRDCLRTTGTPVAFKCCSCGALTLFSQGDAGHFISRSNKNVKFDEKNVFAQCKKCNRYQQGNWDKMYEWIERLHGKETIEDLMTRKNEIAKHVDYTTLSREYREKYNSLKNNS